MPNGLGWTHPHGCEFCTITVTNCGCVCTGQVCEQGGFGCCDTLGVGDRNGFGCPDGVCSATGGSATGVRNGFGTNDGVGFKNGFGFARIVVSAVFDVGAVGPQRPAGRVIAAVCSPAATGDRSPVSAGLLRCSMRY